jgi:hypothetical protein
MPFTDARWAAALSAVVRPESGQLSSVAGLRSEASGCQVQVDGDAQTLPYQVVLDMSGSDS